MERVFKTSNLIFHQPEKGLGTLLYADIISSYATETAFGPLQIMRKIENPSWAVGTMLRQLAESHNFRYPPQEGEWPWYMPAAFPTTQFFELEPGRTVSSVLLDVDVERLYPLADIVALSELAHLRLADSVWILDQLLAVYELLQQTNYILEFRSERFFLDYQDGLVVALDLSGARCLKTADELQVPATDQEAIMKKKAAEAALWEREQNLFLHEIVKIARMIEQITDDIDTPTGDQVISAYQKLVRSMGSALMVGALASDQSGIVCAVRKVLRQLCASDLQRFELSTLETL